MGSLGVYVYATLRLFALLAVPSVDMMSLYNMLQPQHVCAALVLAPQIVMQTALLQLAVLHTHKKAIPADAETQR